MSEPAEPAEGRVVSVEEARRDSLVESLVLAGDLCELARLLVARAKETVLSDHESPIEVVSQVRGEVQELLIQAKYVLDLGAAVAGVCETPTPT